MMSSIESSQSRIKPPKRRLITKFRKTPAGKIDYLSVQDDGSVEDNLSQLDDNENDCDISDISNSTDPHLLDTSHDDPDLDAAPTLTPTIYVPPPLLPTTPSEMDCNL